MPLRVARVGGGNTNRPASARLTPTPRIRTARAATPQNFVNLKHSPTPGRRKTPRKAAVSKRNGASSSFGSVVTRGNLKKKSVIERNIEKKKDIFSGLPEHLNKTLPRAVSSNSRPRTSGSNFKSNPLSSRGGRTTSHLRSDVAVQRRPATSRLASLPSREKSRKDLLSRGRRPSRKVVNGNISEVPSSSRKNRTVVSGSLLNHSEVKGISSMHVEDKAEEVKRNAQISVWDAQQEKQKITESPKEAMRKFRRKMIASNVNMLDSFKKVREASGSDDLLIDEEEFKKTLEMTGVHVRPEVASMLFRELDPDGSGEIDYTEFATKIREPMTPIGDKVAQNTKQDGRVRTLSELRAKRKKMMLAADMGAIDIDGDGLIDEYEIQLSKYLKDVKGKDLDGDGIVSEFERLSAQREKGKELMVNHLRTKYKDRLSHFGRSFRGKSDEVICDALLKAENFGYAMKVMTAKSKMVDLKSSFVMKNALAPRSDESAMKRWRKLFFEDPQVQRRKQMNEVLKRSRARALERAKRVSQYEVFMKKHCGFYKFASWGR